MFTSHFYIITFAFLTFSIGPNLYAGASPTPPQHDVLQIMVCLPGVASVYSMQGHPKNTTYAKALKALKSLTPPLYTEATQEATRLLNQLQSDIKSLRTPLPRFAKGKNDLIYAILVHEEPELRWLLDALTTLLPSKTTEERQQWSMRIIEDKARPILSEMTMQQRDAILSALKPLLPLARNKVIIAQ